MPSGTRGSPCADRRIFIGNGRGLHARASRTRRDGAPIQQILRSAYKQWCIWTVSRGASLRMTPSAGSVSPLFQRIRYTSTKTHFSESDADQPIVPGARGNKPSAPPDAPSRKPSACSIVGRRPRFLDAAAGRSAGAAFARRRIRPMPAGPTRPGTGTTSRLQGETTRC
jgi:hypothetical protein